MFTVTKAAAEQIDKSAQASNLGGMALRLAAKKRPDGSLEYAMGFDQATEDDAEIVCEGVTVVIGPAFVDLLRGATMDYVEIEPGTFSFIFMNPNDANYSPAPTTEA